MEIYTILFNILIDAMLIGLPLAYYFRKKKNPLEELGLFSRGIKEDSKNTLLLFVLLITISFAFTGLLNFLGANDLQNVSDTIMQIKTIIPIYLIYLFVVRIFAEEVFFRGFLVKRIGVLGSSIAFSIVHLLYLSWAEFLGAFVLGLVLAVFYKKNKNIIPNVLAHLLYNFIIVMLIIWTP